MDALAVSLANGLALRPFKPKYAFLMGAYFGFFQFIMPIIGFFVGNAVSGKVQAFGSYISFFLLAFIGIKMILDSIKSTDKEHGMSSLSHKRLFASAVATSIDALAVGVSFAFMRVELIPSCLLIGATTFVISTVSAFIGSRFSNVSGKKAGIIGGAVLVAIGIKILLEGVGIL